jgi:alanyl-tRNA synthetase
MKSMEVRKSFLDFFRARGHEIVPSSPVVLPSDPTLLFVNAGMNQFKDIFLGARESAFRRVADTQKCIRVSGKHNDLEEVGRDTYHHTFFEMLGNWSFGDYYKREAITWAWELLTGVWGLPRARLWATVFRDDGESERLWKEVTDIDPAHILRFGEKDNFWEMGETGPCGPCTEIHYDRTEEGCDPSQINAGTPDVIEIWNLVFMQHNRLADGRLEDLPAKHVDTGMGLERIVAVLQGKASNYDTDLFMPMIRRLERLSGRPYDDHEAAIAMRVIADHLRALSFAIADGVLPSNEGRGYVLRRLLRRAVRFGRKIGLARPFLGEVFPALEETLGEPFPEIVRHRDTILRALRSEEEGFAETLDRGIALFESVAADARERGLSAFPGEQAFKLYDTYGFPPDLTRLMAAEKGLALDEGGFEREMAAQRERARRARREGGGEHAADEIAALVGAGLRSEFAGYERLSVRSPVRALLRNGRLVDALKEGETGEVLLEATPFYAESGGQVGDRGVLRGEGVEARVEDTRKPAEGLLLHGVRVMRGALKPGAIVEAEVEASRRAALQAHHTATHLLNAALRAFVAPSVRQAGSLVAPDRLRFDFTWFEAVPEETLARIEERVNEWIMQNRPVLTCWIPFKDVAGSDIVAIFDEKYGDNVRVVEVKGVSRELCGGTHVSATGQLGQFRILSETSVAAGVRRIEAVCGLPAWRWARGEHELLRELCRRFSATAEELPARIEALLEQNRQLERERKKRTEEAALARVDEWLGSQRLVKGIPLVAADAGHVEMEALRKAAEETARRLGEGVVVLGGESGGKAVFVVVAGDTAVARGAHAGHLAGAIARQAGGGGGGRPNRAQAGGRDGSKVAVAVAEAPALLSAMIEE